MIQKVLHRLLLRRHFWRHATFGEVSELYASRMLRMTAISLSGAFISIYLYQEGLSVFLIGLFWVAYFVLKAIVALPIAAITSWVGPKHGILLSNLLYIPALIAYSLLPVFGWWLIIPIIFFQGISTTLYVVAFAVDFSKVKSATHVGKELAFMHILEKVTTSLAPLVGGVLALFLGPQFVLLLAAVLFVLAAAPLMRTAEPTLRRQKLHFKAFPWYLVRGITGAEWARGFEVFTSGTAWLLFTAIAVVGLATEKEAYAANGLLLSVVLVAALGASYAFGKVIDKRKGGQLLRISAMASSLTHFLRPFVTTPVGAIGMNIAHETTTTGYLLAYHKGVFDSADLSGNRVAFLGILEVISCIGAASGALTFAIAVHFLGDIMGMQATFIVAASVALLIATARFPLFRK